MLSNRFFFFVSVVVIFFSCEGDDEAGPITLITYPSVYHKSGLDPVGNLRVFASTGEIKVNSIVNRFTENDTSYYNSYAKYIRNQRGIIDTVYFFNEQHVVVNRDYEDLDCQLARDNNLLILTETEASNKCCTYGDAITHSLRYQLANVKPEVQAEFIYSSTGGNYIFGFTGRSKYVLEESEGQLVAPLFLYTLHSKNFDGGSVNSFLQTDFYTSLAADDTVTVMEYQILFEK